MFGKIKGKFKNILKKTEEVIKEDEEEELIEKLEEGNFNDNNGNNNIEIEENNKENLYEEVEKEKKGFFKKIFSKSKDEEEVSEDMGVETQTNDKEDNKEPRIKEDEGEVRTKDFNKTNKNDEEKEIKEKKDLKKEELKEEKSFFKKAFSKLSKRKITEDDFDKIWTEIEIYLLDINIAFEVCEKIQKDLREKLIDKEFTIFTLKETILDTLISEVREILKNRESNFLKILINELKNNKPIKILMLGVNGTGKTTTIAKLYYLLKNEGISSVVSASDTFRAAAIEQLEEHSKKVGFKLIKHDMGSDPTAVAFDAVKHAESKGIDVVIIDSAGRMANNKNLMEELKKIKRVIEPNFIILVGDSNSGSDLIEQINLFDENLNIDGVILTKVDTDERPGSIVTTAYTIEKPIYFLGTGQNYDDLVEFNSDKIAEDLFD